MAENSAIEWCDATFNPWIGCTKVSPACDHCYAERDFDLRLRVVQWGAGQARKRTSYANWKLPRQWNAKPFFQCEDCGHRSEGEKWREVGPNMGLTDSGYACPRCNSRSMNEARRRVFCASLADVFDNEVPVEWRRDLFDLIAATPNLDWLLLTKRIGNAKTMMADALHLNPAAQAEGRIWPLPNVWLGATICNQDEADRDIPKLLEVPAAVRFLSIEPMLGPISLTSHGFIAPDEDGPDRIGYMVGPDDGKSGLWPTREQALSKSGLHWIIVGGESGPHARPMHPEWARDLRDQCAAAGVPFLFKQWGEFSAAPPASVKPGERWPATSRLVPVSGNTYAWENFRALEARDLWMHRIGKKAAGRLLDGVEHNRFPEVRA